MAARGRTRPWAGPPASDPESLQAGLRLARTSRRLALAARLDAERAAQAARAECQARTQFFAAASHDLRQPLTALSLFTDALRLRLSDPELMPLVEQMSQSVGVLEALFSELMDLQRLDAGAVRVDPMPVVLDTVFARLRLHFHPPAFEKGLMLRWRGGHHVACADPLLLERVLRNLLSNAIRYTEDGGVLVSCRRRGGSLRLQVWDSGVGIAEPHLPRIFDEFFQVRSERGRLPGSTRGSGLGLAIVRRLVTLMGLPLDVQSRPGHGTVFTLTLPCGTLPPRPSFAAAAAALGWTLEDKPIWVLDASARDGEGLTVLLQAWGARVRCFETLSDWQQALQDIASGAPLPPLRVAAGHFRPEVPQVGVPDLVIVAEHGPAGSGLQALQAAREWLDLPDLPALVMVPSAGADEPIPAHWPAHCHPLHQPVRPQALRAMVAMALGLRWGDGVLSDGIAELRRTRAPAAAVA